MNEQTLVLVLVLGAPAYLYVVVRWIALAAARSYFEVKHEFLKEKKEVA